MANEADGTRSESYLYSFYVWPDETRKDIPKAVFSIFESIKSRIEMEFTPVQFVQWRMDVEMFGLTLREITRVPNVEPAIIL